MLLPISGRYIHERPSLPDAAARNSLTCRSWTIGTADILYVIKFTHICEPRQTVYSKLHSTFENCLFTLIHPISHSILCVLI